MVKQLRMRLSLRRWSEHEVYKLLNNQRSISMARMSIDVEISLIGLGKYFEFKAKYDPEISDNIDRLGRI